jgi:hypothetical protein
MSTIRSILVATAGLSVFIILAKLSELIFRLGFIGFKMSRIDFYSLMLCTTQLVPALKIMSYELAEDQML